VRVVVVVRVGRTADLPLFRIKDRRLGLATLVSQLRDARSGVVLRSPEE
jgi:hypothetical protein